MLLGEIGSFQVSSVAIRRLPGWLSACDIHPPSYPVRFLPDPEIDFLACHKMRLGLRPQVSEVLPLKEQSQSFQLFTEKQVVGILQKR